jgi:hypothetical protein
MYSLFKVALNFAENSVLPIDLITDLKSIVRVKEQQADTIKY